MIIIYSLQTDTHKCNYDYMSTDKCLHIVENK